MSQEIIYPLEGKVNQVIKINNDFEITIGNAFKLLNDDLGEYYEVYINDNIKFTIDKDRIFDILCYNNNNQKYKLVWFMDKISKKYINSLLFNNKSINIVNYLFGHYNILGNRRINGVLTDNTQQYNFRSSNLTFKNKNINPKINANCTIPIFFNNEPVEIITQIQTNFLNRYRIISYQNKKYYEIYLNSYDKNKKEFTFLIDEEDCKILKSIKIKNPFYNQTNEETNNEEINNEDITFNTKTINYTDSTINKEYIIVNNPKWFMLSNQYIVCTCKHVYNNNIKKIMYYIHRCIMNDSINDNDNSDKNTIDHINLNKFDNRRANLRCANMSEQNMNKNIVTRQKTTEDIINNGHKKIIYLDIINKLQNFEYIVFSEETIKNKSSNTIRTCFTIEITSTRCESNKDIRMCSTQSAISNIKNNSRLVLIIKLLHALCIRYYIINKYQSILKYYIDNKNFSTIEEFQNYTNTLITNIVNQLPNHKLNDVTINNISDFLDFMNKLKIPKYVDIRKTLTTNEQNDQVKFDFIQYLQARNKYDIEFIIGKKDGKNIKYRASGLGCKDFTIQDKQAYALLQRYNAFIELENNTNKLLYKDTPFNINSKINKNTINMKTLTDFTIEKQKFKSFNEFKIYTEKCINKLCNSNYTLDQFVEYINNTALNLKVNAKLNTLSNKYPILTK